jgi:DNA integrity scanning protein DisA with diadenylate cyclase activity
VAAGNSEDEVVAGNCTHIDQIQAVTPRTNGCEECLQTGAEWVHLRLCLTCGHVGCCDDSDNKHASAHFHATHHPLIESLEYGEGWRWCYVDESLIPLEIDESEARSGESKGLMTENIVLPISTTTDALSPRAPLPLMGDISASGRSKGMFKSICRRVRRCNKKNLEPTIELAVEIAREGREGRRIGTLFTFGDAAAVLHRSRPLILDPLAGHPEAARQIRDPNLRGTIKELAQLDGAFVVSDEGIVLSACRYLDAMASDVALPYGMASRHLAGASISQVTDAVAIVVSESAMVRVFDDGKLVAEIIPELWLMDQYNVMLSTPYEEQRVGEMAVLTAKA